MTIYQHIRHPRIAARSADRPVKVADMLPRASATLHEVAHVQGHLAARDVLLTRIAEKLGLDPVPVIDAPPGEEPAAAPED